MGKMAYLASHYAPRFVCNVVDAFHNVINFSNGIKEERYLVVMELCTGDLFDYILNKPNHKISEDDARYVSCPGRCPPYPPRDFDSIHSIPPSLRYSQLFSGPMSFVIHVIHGVESLLFS